MTRSFRNLLLVAFFGSVALPPVAVLALPSSAFSAGKSDDILIYTVVCGLLALPCFYILLRRVEPHLVKEALAQAAYLEKFSRPFLWLAIAGSAALSLFLELAMIRWQASVFELFSYYKNFGLLACFAGLGLGYALSRQQDGIPLSLTPFLLAWQFGLLTFLRFGLPDSSLSLRAIPFREQLSMGLLPATPPQVRAVYFLLALTSLLTALAFIPIGQLCGKLMENTGQLSAYGYNLLGSLAGVAIMFLASLLWTPPVIWFGLCFLAILGFLMPQRKTLMVGATLSALALAILAWPVNPLWNKIYSPYQLLEVGYSRSGFMLIRAGGHYYQRVQDLSASAMGLGSPVVPMRDYYNLPYHFHLGAKTIAVVGAGTGNDVAAALRSGAQHVDAIEIDPALFLAGKMNHPEKPYDDPRVRAVITDARSFLRNTSTQYDMIVYGLLDSHTLLSETSSVRLDSFVYTMEGLREARAKLKDDGVLSLAFTVINDSMGAKIYQMMRAAFDGNEPVCLFSPYDDSVLFLESNHGDLSFSPGPDVETRFEDRSSRFRNSTMKIDVSTDDWPFFYMPRRVYPVSYLIAIGLVLLISFAMFASFLPQAPQASQLAFFFLGAGFMLVETKAITEMGLVFGNTWQVIAFAISSILVMAFLGNFVVQKLRVTNAYFVYLFLLGSLAFGWWIARAGGLPPNWWGKIGTAIILTCPLFFSGIAFSMLLRGEVRISSAMSMNLLGAMCGGILEYNSMYFGFQFLYLLAICLYAGALISSLLLRKSRSLATVPNASLLSSTD